MSPTKLTRARSREDSWIKALRKSELRYRRLFETAQDGILILDAESGKITDANPFLLELLDYEFKELRGCKLWELGQFKDIAANHLAFEKLQRSEHVRYKNLPLRRSDGTKIPVEFVSNVYRVDKRRVIQCNIRTRSDTWFDSGTPPEVMELAHCNFF